MFKYLIDTYRLVFFARIERPSKSFEKAENKVVKTLDQFLEDSNLTPEEKNKIKEEFDKASEKIKGRTSERLKKHMKDILVKHIANKLIKDAENNNGKIEEDSFGNGLQIDVKGEIFDKDTFFNSSNEEFFKSLGITKSDVLMQIKGSMLDDSLINSTKDNVEKGKENVNEYNDNLVKKAKTLVESAQNDLGLSKKGLKLIFNGERIYLKNRRGRILQRLSLPLKNVDGSLKFPDNAKGNSDIIKNQDSFNDWVKKYAKLKGGVRLDNTTKKTEALSKAGNITSSLNQILAIQNPDFYVTYKRKENGNYHMILKNKKNGIEKHLLNISNYNLEKGFISEKFVLRQINKVLPKGERVYSADKYVKIKQKNEKIANTSESIKSYNKNLSRVIKQYLEGVLNTLELPEGVSVEFDENTKKVSIYRKIRGRKRRLTYFTAPYKKLNGDFINKYAEENKILHLPGNLKKWIENSLKRKNIPVIDKNS